MNAPETLAMQDYCVHCGREQWAPAVREISNGLEACVWCGKKSTPMTEAEYRSMRHSAKGGQE